MVLAREVMTAPAVTVLPHARVKQAIRLLHDHDITALPVVDASGVLLGIVTEMDFCAENSSMTPGPSCSSSRRSPSCHPGGWTG